MRGVLATLAVIGGVLLGAAPAGAHRRATDRAARIAQTPAARLTRALRRDLGRSRPTSGAYVLDLTTGHVLYSSAASLPRYPASVEKLYTTSTALLRFGPDARLTTSVLGVGSLDSTGTWNGTLYLKGGGDPTFGSARFDQSAYGTGATVQQLASHLRAAGIRALAGSVVGDASQFDVLKGTPPYGYAPSLDVEGVLSALAFNRGWWNRTGTIYQRHPALFATQQFAAALRGAGIAVPAQTPIETGLAPPAAQPLAAVHSPRIAYLIRMTNAPSDNFFAEMLLKDIGASFGGAGTTAAGAAVVRAQVASSFGITPALEDGSGLSRRDLTTPIQVVTLLRDLSGNPDFTSSLAIGGETGTMEIGLRGTAAAGRCRGKTGTLSDVANLVGYCTAQDGHTLAFAFLMNAVNPVAGHSAEDAMAVALARYSG